MHNEWLVNLAKVVSDFAVTGLPLLGLNVRPELVMVKLTLLGAQALLILVRSHARVVNLIGQFPLAPLL